MPTELGAAVQSYLHGRVARGDLDPMSARNHRSTLTHLADHYGPHPVAKLRRRHIDRWLETRGQLKPSTRRSQLSMVRMFCRHLTQEGLVPSDPSIGLKPVRQPRTVPRALNDQDAAAILSAAPDARGRAIVALQLWCGLRCVEVSRLCIEDWDRRDDLLRLRGKNDHEREVPVPPECARHLDNYLAEHPGTVGPFVRSYRDPSVAITADTVSGMVSEWMRAAGVKRAARDGRSAHALRHSAASDVLDRCNDLRVVQQMLGHRHLATTSVYLRRVDLPKMREAMTGRTYA